MRRQPLCRSQAEAAGAVLLTETVEQVELGARPFHVFSHTTEVACASLIVATGALALPAAAEAFANCHFLHSTCEEPPWDVSWSCGAAGHCREWDVSACHALQLSEACA